MKGVVLAGGTGSRLRPITHAEPKQSLPLANIPVVVRAIHDLRAAGITQIVVILGNNGRDRIREVIAEANPNIEVAYEIQGAARGLADAVGAAREFVGDDPFVVHFGDVVFSDGIKPLVESFDPTGEVARLGTHTVDAPSEHAIVETNDGQAEHVHEKPDDPPGVTSPVVDVFTPKIFDAIDAISPSDRGELEIIDAIQHLINSGETVGVVEMDGWWRDTGTPDAFLEANSLLLEEGDSAVSGFVPPEERIKGPKRFRNGAQVGPEATVVGPVSLAPCAVVKGTATVGPAVSVGSNAVVSDATIQNSVLCSGARLAVNHPVEDSIIPRQATVESTSGERYQFRVCKDADVMVCE